MIPGVHGRVQAAAILTGAALLLVLGPRLLDRSGAPIAGTAARVSGGFREGGEVPLDKGIAADGARWNGFPRHLPPPGGGRIWSSWNGSDANTGELVLGPFSAPRILGLCVCGYPLVDGDRLYLENTATGARLDVATTNIGASWSELRLALPAPWRGAPVTVHAVDGSGAYFGWLAVGEPRAAPAYAAGWTSFARKLATFSAVGLLLFLLQGAALEVVGRRPWIPAALVPITSFALVAVAGYAAFWVFLASAVAGKAMVWAALALAAWRRIAAGKRSFPLAGLPIVLMASIGALYFGVLLLYGSDRSLSDIAAHRFIDTLAVDNELPEMFADRLVHGEDPRHLAFGWWSSGDRPPLQAGCDLLLAYPVAAAGADFETAAQASGIWMQLTWVCAAWAWLLSAGIGRRGAVLIVALLAPTGFLLLNSVYVWPKLLAASFTLGAFAWFLSMIRSDRREFRELPAVAFLACLGFLAQAGTAFSLIAWIPFACAVRRHASPRSWLAAAAVFAVLAVPWAAYQRYFDPPSNLLLKWHLGGANIPDSRGTWETIRSAYHSKGVAELAGIRRENLATLVRGPWLDRVLDCGGNPMERRSGEYYGVFLALGPWILGFIALAALMVPGWRRTLTSASALLLSASWCFATLGVWLLLMFLPVSTVIHQGSYACVLLLFLCLAASLWISSRWAFLAVAAYGAMSFAATWMGPNPSRPGPFQPAAAALAVIGGAALAAIAWSVRTDNTEAA
jgi:hypothetical protein